MSVLRLWLTLLALLVASACGTLQRDVVTYINVFRHLHAVGPLLVNENIQKAAQQAATKYAITQNKNSATATKYSSNYCIFAGVQSHLPQTCAISWYSTIGSHKWCNPQTKGAALPFVNMIWKSSAQVGVGIAKGTGAKFFVVVYFMLQDMKIQGNVPPVKLVMEASPKAMCSPGYSRNGTSCFKYHTARMTWDEAIIQCAKENATLASIRNGKEEEFVRRLEKAVSGDETWIGLHDRFQEGQFNWLDGLKFQPGVCVPVRATGNNNENCVAWSIKRPQGCWSDRPCGQKLPFTCRIPVEGKSTYRTEILFKKYRWNPKFADPNSKAYKNLIKGIKVTFKEIFTRLSGKKKAGFRKIKIKSLRPVKFPGRPLGLAITLSVKFRSLTPDPTLRFTSFLRSSEKVLSVSIDKPDKVPGKSVGAGNYCSSPCTAQLQGTCGGTIWYPPTFTCPQNCLQTTVQPCPQSCPASCCNGVHQPSSPYAYYPGYASTAVYRPPSVTQAMPPAQPATAAPSPSPSPSPATYQPYYSQSCHTRCGQYSTLDCYMHCNDECCRGERKKEDKANSTAKLITKMKQNIHQIKRVIKLAELKMTANATQNTSETFKPSKLVTKLQGNLGVLEKRLRDANQTYMENFETNDSSLEEQDENFDEVDKSEETEFIPENSDTLETDDIITALNDNYHPNPREIEEDPNSSLKELNDNSTLGSDEHNMEDDVPQSSSTHAKDRDQSTPVNASESDNREGDFENNLLNRETNSSETAGYTSPAIELAVNAVSSGSQHLTSHDRTGKSDQSYSRDKNSTSIKPNSNPTEASITHHKKSTNVSENFPGMNSAEVKGEKLNPEQASSDIDNYYNRPANALDLTQNSNQSQNEIPPNLKEPDVEIHVGNVTGTYLGEASKSKNAPAKSANSLSELETSTIKSSNPLSELENTTAKSSNQLSELENTTIKSSNPLSKLENTTVKSSNPLSELENTIVKSSNPLSELENTIVKSSNQLSEWENTTIKSSNPLSKLENTTVKSSNPLSKLENTTVKSSNPLSELENTTFKSSNPLSELENSTVDSSIALSELENTTVKSSNPLSELENTTVKSSNPLSELENSTVASSNPLSELEISTVKSSNPLSELENTTVNSSNSLSELENSTRESANSQSEMGNSTVKSSGSLSELQNSEVQHNSINDSIGFIEKSSNTTKADLNPLRTATNLDLNSSKVYSFPAEELNSSDSHSHLSEINVFRTEAQNKSGSPRQALDAHKTTENMTHTYSSHLNTTDTTADSKVNKSKYSYHVGDISNIDDGLSNDTSLKEGNMSSRGAWNQGINHGNNRTNQTFLVQNVSSSDANQKQSVDNQEQSIDKENKEDADDEQSNDQLHDLEGYMPYREAWNQGIKHENNRTNQTFLFENVTSSDANQLQSVDNQEQSVDNQGQSIDNENKEDADDEQSNDQLHDLEGYMPYREAWNQGIKHENNGTNQTFLVENVTSSNANQEQSVDNQEQSVDNQGQSIDNENKEDAGDEQLNDQLHDPDAVSNIDGNDPFRDESMENRPQGDDIDDGIPDNPLNLQRVEYQGVVGRKRNRIEYLRENRDI